tara:strand:- start:2432 stop:3475 length:1044 start_codon:yes stop_codon:yes gene_type:complete
MAIAASGAVSFSNLRTEFVGGSGAISYSNLYRGGSNIRAKAGNNTGVNLAASVPTSGAINFTNFRSQAKGFRFTYTTTSTDQDADTLFGSDYAVDYPKEIVINSGVTIGGVSDDALDIPSTLAGTLVINNNGSIIGKAGTANGGAGGHAINNAASNVTINNAGSLLAGGGGGGQGGTGGNGSSTTTTVSTRNSYPSSTWQWTTGAWSGVGSWTHSGGSTSKSYGGHNFYRGSYAGSIGSAAYYQITGHIVSNVSTSGGTGGAGGIGQGYTQTNASGASGAAGGTNAGTGGTGGAGATYGNAGSTGSTGANGNSSNGSSGSSGGAAGAAVLGTSVTMNNTGTLAGAVA